MFPSPYSFRCHPNLSDEVNHNIVQSEIEGGVFLSDLPPATVLEIQTQHHCYMVVLLSDNNALISGHPRSARNQSGSSLRDRLGAVPCSNGVSSVEVCAWSFVIRGT